MQKTKFAGYLLVVLSVSLSVTGCETIPTSKSAPDFCAAAKPIYTHKTDRFANTTADAILTHNKTGRNLCGWKPLSKK